MIKTFIIAEVGFNHGGDLNLAKQMIDAAKASGAHAVKFQSFLAGDLALPNAPHYSLIKEGELTEEGHQVLFNYCQEVDIEFMSTPFSLESVDLLMGLGIDRFKVASMDACNRTLLSKIAATKKPIIISTGMCTLEEIQQTEQFLNDLNVEDFSFLHCQSLYPADAPNLNLACIQELKSKLKVAVGYSDHFPGVEACKLAVTQGATIIETHFTLDNTIAEGDHSHSADPAQLKELVEYSQFVETALGTVKLDEDRPDYAHRQIFRRGIHALKDIKKGELFSEENISYCRPANDLDPYNQDLYQSTASRDIPAFDSISDIDTIQGDN